MPLYFFDTRDGETFIEDEIGLEYENLEAVKVEAARSLAELAREVVPGSVRRELTVEVRDDAGPVLLVRMIFEALILQPPRAIADTART